MATLYLVQQNTILRKTGERVLLCSKKPGTSSKPGVRQSEILLELPCDDIDHVMLFGNIQMTTQAMQQLLLHDIETAIFTAHGKLIGQLTPVMAKNIELRKQQYAKAADENFCLTFSKRIVQAKINAALENVKKFNYNHPKQLNADLLTRLEKQYAAIESAENLKSLLGLEGTASSTYFTLLGQMLPNEWNFPKRSRRPPKDEPNAVLSFGYTIVGSELQALLDGVGFDPYLGFYHQTHYGRASLALDLLECFRHSFVDKLMLKLFNLGILTKEDFQPVAHEGIYLNNSGKRKFFVQYEKMAGEYKGELPNEDLKIGFRQVFQKMVYNLVNHIQKDEPLTL